MFIGEAPGESEDLSGIPFVGRAGKLFDKFLIAVGINRDDVYIANILKCRPPQNRDPKPEEEDMCIQYLNEQIEAIKPRFVVCLGRIAAMRLIDPNFRIMVEHGKWFTREKYEICAVLHPSAVLRDPRKNELMLKDMMDIREKVFGPERN
jgi:DNA polymerase